MFLKPRYAGSRRSWYNYMGDIAYPMSVNFVCITNGGRLIFHWLPMRYAIENLSASLYIYQVSLIFGPHFRPLELE